MRVTFWLRFTALLSLASWWLFLRRELLICRARVPLVLRWCILARVASYVTATKTPLHVADVMRGELLALAPRLGPDFARPFGWLFDGASKLTLAAREGV